MPDENMSPRTEAGRRLVRWSNERGYDLYGQAVAIETEAYELGLLDAFDDVRKIDAAEYARLQSTDR